MLKQLHLIRHGITEGNEKGWYYGATDIGLSETGRAELTSLSKDPNFPFSVRNQTPNAKYFTTGMLRTEETFNILFDNRPHTAISELREMNFGEFEKHTHEELLTREEYRIWIEDAKNDDYILPGGESRNQFRSRIKKAFDDLVKDLYCSDTSDYVLVCHGGTIGVTMERLFCGQRESFFQWIPKPGHGFTLVMDNDGDMEFSLRTYLDF